MQAAARNPRYLRWAMAVAENVSLPLTGYVWEEDGRLTGNLSLIPFNIQGKRSYLIANVAVDPACRRRGIARALTTHALQHARAHGATQVWLHVREENLPAINLYLSLGFVEKARRTTWECAPQSTSFFLPRSGEPSGITITRPQPAHWVQIRTWMSRIYPPELTWHLPYDLKAYRPGLWGSIYRFLTAAEVWQWAAMRHDRLLGVLTWQRSTYRNEHLWLATGFEEDSDEESVIAALIPHARRIVNSKRRLLIDYPAGRGGHAFEQAGFRIQQTLIWMRRAV
jgi:GNAT superfamily N-acetyltransferase